MCSMLRIISCGETVGEQVRKRSNEFYIIRGELLTQKKEVSFCLNHKELNRAEGTDETLGPALYRR